MTAVVRDKSTDLKGLIRELAKIQNQLTTSKYMTSDDCPANKAYQSIEEAMSYLTEALGMTEDEAQEFLDSLQRS